MPIRLLLVQSAICLFWIFFLASGINPINLPLLIAFGMWPIVGLISDAKVPIRDIIPILTLLIVGYAAWLTGWQPESITFTGISTIIFLLAWIEGTRKNTETQVGAFCLGLVLYSPLAIITISAIFGVFSIWPAAMGLTVLGGALIYALRDGWSVTAAITGVTILRINGLAMLLLPVAFITDPTSIYGVHIQILGIGGAASLIVMTRQQLLFRRKLIAATYELSTYMQRDQLTGLFTWVGLVDRLNELKRETWFVICVDINGFNAINVAHGFEVGDNLLRHIGSELPGQWPQALHARVGGDYFVSVFPTNDGVDARTYTQAFEAMASAFNPDITVRATAGRSLPGTQDVIEELLAQSDLDMAKRRLDIRKAPRLRTTS
ncbi:diguanylate cyclase domain-containing protein [Stomatohabitans albus]|uniref:diguanylate cyclase domain-containing protein n=1 Tax=Stomatohabitans albus TaxID=3110766 RepID=UPI00300D8739